MKRKRKNAGNDATTVSIKPPPMRPSVIESEVVVPLAWSLLLAVSLAVVGTLATLALCAALDARWDWWLPLAAGGCVGVLVFAWRCTVCEADRRSLLFWPLEVAMGVDLDQDGYVGEPEPEVTLEQEQDPRIIYVRNARQEQWRRNAGDFRHFLRSAYDGRGTTWRKWDDAELPSGRRMTRPLWEMWTARLQKAGLATRAYPTAELELTGGYRQALETLSELL